MKIAEMDQRIRDYVEHLDECEDDEVVEQFKGLLEASPDPRKENLFLMLQEAKRTAPGLEKREMCRKALLEMANTPMHPDGCSCGCDDD